MSRPLRIDYPGAWHHVMNRSRRGTDLYLDDEDYEAFLALVQKASAMYHMNVAAYCLMPNHYHLLVQTEDGNLARCMRHINGIYTQKFNIRHDCDGTLFRGRYKSVLVQEDSYLLQLVRYIHKNPIKAGLTDTLSDYKWSSHKGYICSEGKWQWLYKAFVLSMISQNKQTEQYKAFMGLEVSNEIESFYLRKNQPPILGDEIFLNWVKDSFSRKKSNQEIPESKQLAPEIDLINNIVATAYNVQLSQLFAAKRGFENEPRDIAIYLARQLRGEPLKKIGVLFNLSRVSSVSSVFERVNRRMETDRKFKKKVEEIKGRLRKGQT